jgi:adenine-specific DNA-methyltransferase
LVNDKKTGSFFTPGALARSVVNHLDLHLHQSECHDLAVLEPSVGNGAFLQALAGIQEIHDRIASVDVVDIEPSFIEECRSIVLLGAEVDYACEDFIIFEGRNSGYDIVVGNPPYVSYKHLSEIQVAAGRAYFEANGLQASDFRNLWTLFLLKASVLLKPEGIMAFVLPKEVIYVNHASWLRSLLLRTFARVEVFVFDELHFDHADQDVAVILCYRAHKLAGLYISEGRGGRIDPEGLRLIEVDQFYGSKWSQFKISDDGNALLRRCAQNFLPLETYCTAVAGIVPAASSFFIVDSARVDALDARSFARPIVQRSNYIGKNLGRDRRVGVAGLSVGRLQL